MARQLTDRQAEILAFITAYRLRSGYSPSYREIGRHFGIRSTNGIRDHLVALERKGHLSRLPGAQRAFVPANTTPGAAPKLSEEALSRATAAFIDDAASVGVSFFPHASAVRRHLRAAFDAAFTTTQEG